MLLAWISLGTCCLSILLNSIGLGIPYWLNYTTSQVDIHVGLWRFCISTPGQEYCGSVPSIPKVSAADVACLKATRIFIIISMVAIFLSGLTHILKLYAMKQQAMLPKVAAALGLLSGVAGLLGIIIFAAQFDNYKYDPLTLDLYAGFGLCTVAGVLSAIAGILPCFIKRAT